MKKVYEGADANPTDDERIVKFQTDRRHADQRRYKVFLPAILGIGDSEFRVHLLNISKAGAKLHVNIAMPRSTPIKVSVPGANLIGHVQWADRNSTGIKFLQPISISTIEKIIA